MHFRLEDEENEVALGYSMEIMDGTLLDAVRSQTFGVRKGKSYYDNLINHDENSVRVRLEANVRLLPFPCVTEYDRLTIAILRLHLPLLT